MTNTDNHFIRFRMRLFECATVLFEVEFLGYTKAGGTRICDAGAPVYRPFLAVPVQCADAGMVRL